MSKKGIIAIAVIIGVLIIDQVLKVWIKTSFEPGEIQNLFGEWFRLHYIENRGMAFGTTLGDGDWSKLILSVFRILAVSGIAYYLYKIIKEKQPLVYIIAIALIWAGAFGNIIDSAFYDLIFEPVCAFDCNMNVANCYDHLDVFENLDCKKRGFLHGNVVDMFQFNATWPWDGGGQIFPAIFNVADFAISCGVGLIIVQYRKIFGKKNPNNTPEETKEQEA